LDHGLARIASHVHDPLAVKGVKNKWIDHQRGYRQPRSHSGKK
jgi:hypothetical protein